jgi:hypothetical protein
MGESSVDASQMKDPAVSARETAFHSIRAYVHDFRQYFPITVIVRS